MLAMCACCTQYVYACSFSLWGKKTGLYLDISCRIFPLQYKYLETIILRCSQYNEIIIVFICIESKKNIFQMFEEKLWEIDLCKNNFIYTKRPHIMIEQQ